MPRPEPAEYNQAIQNPRLCFDDPELQSGWPELDTLGLPQAVSGAFASVYRMHCGRRDWAVRCFLREFTDQDRRYGEISRHLSITRLSYSVGFEFQAKGIRVGGRWYPILKMEWVQGEPLNSYIQRHLHDPAALRRLAGKWTEMMRTLNQSGIAHGDLQPGNVMVLNGNLLLIDYDGMYVPALHGLTNHELGHRDYQSPSRDASHFGPYLDNFSAWVIYLSLLAFSVEPGLGAHVAPDAEHLLFRREDFERPQSSKAFRALERLQDPEIRALTPVFRSFVSKDLALLPPLARDTTRRGAPPSVATGPRPSWLDDRKPTPAPENGAPPPKLRAAPWGASGWVMEHLQHSSIGAIATAQGRSTLLWLVIIACAGILFGAPFAVAVGEAGVLLGWALTALLLVLVIRYLLLPGVPRMLAAWLALKTAQIAAWMAEETLKRIEERKEALGPTVQRMLVGLYSKHSDLGRDEQEELRRLDADLRTALDAFDAEGSATWKEQLAHIQQAIQEHQESYLLAELGRSSIFDATIPGVSWESKRLLEASGIRTALDLGDMRMVRTGRGDNFREVMCINTAGRGELYIDSIGPDTARSLQDWRCEMETRARAGIPESLPPGRVRFLSAPYRTKRQRLKRQRSSALRRADERRDAIERRYARCRARLDMRAEDAHNRFKLREQELAREATTAAENLHRRSVAAELAGQRLADYRAVTPGEYLKSLLLGDRFPS